MGSLSKLAVAHMRNGEDLTSEWTDNVADQHEVSWWKAFLLQFYYPKLLLMERLDGARQTSIHEIPVAEAIKMVKADTEGFLEDRGASIGGVLYIEDNDVSRVFRRR